MLAAEYVPGWSEDRKRLLVRSMVQLWKTCGQHPAWHAIFTLRGHPGWQVKELWKHQLYETFDYSWERDYTHQLKAARVDILEAGTPTDALSWDPTVRAWVNRVIQKLRPVHVLVRVPAREPDAIASPWPLSCDSGCEAGCETACETGPCELFSVETSP